MENMISETIFLTLGWAGLYGSVVLAAIGSMVGCTIVGQAACGAAMEVESGHGKYIGLAAIPSSQAIYGFIIAYTLNNVVMQAGGMSVGLVPALVSVGLLSGLAMFYCALKQGQCLAAAVKVSKTKPEVYGVSLLPAFVVEGFALLAFLLALLLSANFTA